VDSSAEGQIKEESTRQTPTGKNKKRFVGQSVTAFGPTNGHLLTAGGPRTVSLFSFLVAVLFSSLLDFFASLLCLLKSREENDTTATGRRPRKKMLWEIVCESFSEKLRAQAEKRKRH